MDTARYETGRRMVVILSEMVDRIRCGRSEDEIERTETENNKAEYSAPTVGSV